MMKDFLIFTLLTLLSFNTQQVCSYVPSYSSSSSSSQIANVFQQQSQKTSKLVMLNLLKKNDDSVSMVDNTGKKEDNENHLTNKNPFVSRRSLFLQSSSLSFMSPFFVVSSSMLTPSAAFAASTTKPSLDALLYTILRVREATVQETRLIRSGNFKDAQRGNVKLAIKFVIENYRLADTFVKASTYLDTNDKRLAASSVGQSVVQNLYTILEYFDASDVQNIKVNAMSGEKESIVLKGLDASRKGIDEFLAYFPDSTVDLIKAKIEEENALNVKEFDPELGQLLNMPKPS